MSKAVRIHATGGPEVLLMEEVPTPSPGPGEVLIEQRSIGLNFIDVYFRNGLYKLPKLPAVIGMEGAGVVVQVGAGVTEVAIGDRVAYAGVIGAYALKRVISAERLIRLPETIDFDTAAAMMLQGLTAYYLLHQTHPLSAGETIVVHAAAGGVGLILCQWARALGATVIGVVSTEEKAQLARQAGAEHVLIGLSRLPDEVKRLTGGSMARVVYDGTGKETFDASLDCLAPRGLMVSFGNATGEVTGLNLSILAQKGSLFLTRPTLATHIASRSDLVTAADALIDMVTSGRIAIRVGQRFALADAADAHRALEGRRTSGSTVLIP